MVWFSMTSLSLSLFTNLTKLGIEPRTVFLSSDHASGFQICNIIVHILPFLPELHCFWSRVTNTQRETGLEKGFGPFSSASPPLVDIS